MAGGRGLFWDDPPTPAAPPPGPPPATPPDRPPPEIRKKNRVAMCPPAFCPRRARPAGQKAGGNFLIGRKASIGGPPSPAGNGGRPRIIRRRSPRRGRAPRPS